MPNTPYENFFLSNEVEDQFNSRLDLMRFCRVDRGLEGRAGMKRMINVYSATDGTQKLTQGQGNTTSIEVGFVQKEYEIALAQNRFEYYDEELMKDPMVPLVGARHAGVDMFNTVNADIYGEFAKATRILPVSALDFGAFADAQAMLNLEGLEDVYTFAFVASEDVAKIRKALKDDLKYVEAFSRQGYIGTVGGTNIHLKKDATPGKIYLATQDAVTMFVKTGTEVEQYTEGNRSAADANIRKNTLLTRKYYIVALTDETKDIAISLGAKATATADTTVTAGKTYYKKDGAGYVAVVPAEGANPATEGWYEIA